MNEQQIQSLTRVLSYLEDEQTHFEASSEDERANHIYLDIRILQEYLTHNQGEQNP